MMKATLDITDLTILHILLPLYCYCIWHLPTYNTVRKGVVKCNKAGRHFCSVHIKPVLFAKIVCGGNYRKIIDKLRK